MHRKGAGELAHWAKCLLLKRGDLSSDPSACLKSQLSEDLGEIDELQVQRDYLKKVGGEADSMA